MSVMTLPKCDKDLLEKGDPINLFRASMKKLSSVSCMFFILFPFLCRLFYLNPLYKSYGDMRREVWTLKKSNHFHEQQSQQLTIKWDRALRTFINMKHKLKEMEIVKSHDVGFHTGLGRASTILRCSTQIS